MEQTAPVMHSLVLHAPSGDAQGTARLEEESGKLVLVLHAEGLEPETSLRILLLSAGEEGAALDLGPAQSTSAGAVSCVRSLPPAGLHLWDALALAEDWPSGRLVAAGWLHPSGGPVWRLAEAAARFLAVPAKMYPASGPERLDQPPPLG